VAVYNDKVMDHFMNPRNVGELENPDGTGIYGSPICGDRTSIFIKVDGDKITDAKFKTFGCASAKASSSIATEMMIGKTVEEALSMTTEQIVVELGGLPDAKVHCSVLANHAIKCAVYDYAKKTGKTYEGLKDFNPDVDEEHRAK